MRSILTKTGLAAGLVCFTTLSFGLIDQPIKNHEIALQFNNKDIALISQAEHRLIRKSHIGAITHWFNAQSGRGGCITLLKRFWHHKMRCVKLSYHFYHSSGQRYHFVFDKCHHQGQWRFLR